MNTFCMCSLPPMMMVNDGFPFDFSWTIDYSNVSLRHILCDGCVISISVVCGMGRGGDRVSPSLFEGMKEQECRPRMLGGRYCCPTEIAAIVFVVEFWMFSLGLNIFCRKHRENWGRMTIFEWLREQKFFYGRYGTWYKHLGTRNRKFSIKMGF